MAFAIGLGADLDNKKGKVQGKAWLVVFLVVGVIINLSLGTVWFAFSNGLEPQIAFAAAFVPFIGVEAIKAAGAVTVGIPVRYAVKRIKQNRHAG
jgi:biotin transporter BioY